MQDLVLSVAVIIGLIEVLKRLGLKTDYAPAVAVVLGIGGNLLFKLLGVDYSEPIITGIVAGLSACGLYDQVKKGKIIGKKTIANTLLKMSLGKK